MKNLLVIIFIFVLTNNIYAENEFDIRNVKWGMPKVEVMASESMKPIRVTDEYISYNFELMGEKTFLLYEFIKNSLLSARYVIEKPSTTINNKIKKILVLKYGEPIVEKEFFRWKKDDLIVLLEVNKDFLKVIYKSKKIEEFKKKYEEKLNKKEKDYLISIF
jgi:hypothetical protein